MGRLFQYNRLGISENPKSSNNTYKRKEKHDRNLICSAYSDLYGEYKICSNDKNETCSKDNMWINRFLCTDIFNSQALTCRVYARSRSRPCHENEIENENENENDNENELLMGGRGKRTKVFDCMKEFFKRKFFQQHHDMELESAKTTTSDNNWDITSDYEDIDSSYNADEEDDCEDLSGDYAAAKSSKFQQNTCLNREVRKACSPAKQGPLRSALSFSCWQQSTSSSENQERSTFSNNTDNEATRACNDNFDEIDESNDDGISDCCKLISVKIKPPTKRDQKSRIRCNHSQSKKRSFKKLRRNSRTIGIFNSDNDNDNDDNDDGDDDDDDDSTDIMSTSWYQPRITTKAAYERLQKSMPGSFLVRRKARTFELCVRSQTKVKQFTVIETNASYKLKGAQKQFSSLKALVTHHSVMAEQLPLTLLLPRSHHHHQQRHKQEKQRYDDDFDTFESLQILDLLKTLQTKNFER